MTNLVETSVWETGIYQISTDDAVQGGAPVQSGGVFTKGYANAPTQQLANRTQYLKAQLTTLSATVTGMGNQITSLSTQNSDILTRLGQAESAIGTLQTNVGQLQSDIAAATSDIAGLSSRLTTLEAEYAAISADITSINSTLSDHETRITDLENNSGGGSVGTSILDIVDSNPMRPENIYNVPEDIFGKMLVLRENGNANAITLNLPNHPTNLTNQTNEFKFYNDTDAQVSVYSPEGSNVVWPQSGEITQISPNTIATVRWMDYGNGEYTFWYVEQDQNGSGTGGTPSPIPGVLTKANFESKLKARYGQQTSYFYDAELGFYSQFAQADITDVGGADAAVARLHQYPFYLIGSGTGAGVYAQRSATWSNTSTVLTTGTTAAGSASLWVEPIGTQLAISNYSVIEERFNVSFDFTSGASNRYTFTATGINGTSVSYTDTVNSGQFVVSYKDSAGATQTINTNINVQNQYNYEILMRYEKVGADYLLTVKIDTVPVVSAVVDNYLTTSTNSPLVFNGTLSIAKSIGATARQAILGTTSCLAVLA